MPVYSYEIVDSADLRTLRDMQVKELRGTAQDGTEEGIVTYGADFVRIANNGKTIGYACIGTYDFYKDMILEYFITCDCRADSAGIIMQLTQKYKCAQWLVSTHDFFTFPLLLDLRLPYEIDAYKFALDDSIRIEYELEPGMTVEATTSEEISEAYPLIMQDNFYTGGNMDTLFPLIAGNEMYSLRKDGRLIGVGFVGVSKRTPRYADIAMIIDRENRRNGYGVLLVKALVAKCRLQNLIPTAVCDVNNVASRKVLQKVGFHLDGCLLLAQVKGLS